MTTLPQPLDVWVLAGQSNMEGVGALSTALPSHPHVWCFTSAGQWEIAQEPLHWFWESCTPVHPRLCRAGLPAERQGMSDAEIAALVRNERKFGAGLGLPFAQAMTEATGVPVGLIAAAHGGTSLEQWDPSGKAQGGDSLYGSMLERIARAGGRLCGILWYQGESDAWGPESAVTYGDRFAAWVASVRADLQQPNLPVLTVQLGGTTFLHLNGETWDIVRRAQYALPDRVPYTTVTSAVDLGLEDVIHINTQGLVRLGQRMARQMLALDGVAGYTTGPRVVRVEQIERAPMPVNTGLLRVVCRQVAERWLPGDHLSGFELRDAAGQPIPGTENAIINAWPDPEDPTTLLIRTNLPTRPGDQLAYACGLCPYANVVDAADMPLCAFMLPIT